MHATLRIYKLKPGTNATINNAVNDQFLSIVTKVPGFVAYQVVDSGKDEWASFTVFQTADGAAEATRRAADFVAANLKAMVASGPTVIAGNLAVNRLG